MTAIRILLFFFFLFSVFFYLFHCVYCIIVIYFLLLLTNYTKHDMGNSIISAGRLKHFLFVYKMFWLHKTLSNLASTWHGGCTNFSQLKDQYRKNKGRNRIKQKMAAKLIFIFKSARIIYIYLFNVK